jgi:hypothetical protein
MNIESALNNIADFIVKVFHITYTSEGIALIPVGVMFYVMFMVTWWVAFVAKREARPVLYVIGAVMLAMGIATWCIEHLQVVNR